MDSNDQQRQDLAARFIIEGFDQGHKIIYIYAETSPSAMIAALRKLDARADQAVLDGELVFRSIKEMIPPGAANPWREIPGLIQDAVEKAMAEGYPILRCMVDISSPRPEALIEQDLVKYETALNKICADFPVIALCRYDRHQIAPALLLEMLSEHPQVISDGVVYPNHVFIPTAGSDRSDHGDHDRAATWLDLVLKTFAARQKTQQHIGTIEKQLASEVARRDEAEHRLEEVKTTLQEAEERYSTLLESSSDAILVQNLNGVILHVNRITCQLFGYRTEEMLGMSAHQLVAPEFRPVVWDLMESAKTRDSMLFFESIYMARDGQRLPVVVKARRIGYKGTAAILTIVRDITERKQSDLALRRSEAQLRKSEAQLRSLVERAPIGIVLANEEGTVIEWNSCAEEMYQLPVERVLGRPIWEVNFDTSDESLRTPEAFAEIKEKMEAFFRSGTAPWLYQFENRSLIWPNGEQRFVQMVNFPIRTERGSMLATMIRDETDQRKAEIELENYGQQLSSMVEQRTAELEQRTAELQHEVSERQKVEDVLRESEGRYRALVNQSPLSILVEQDGHCIFANPAIVQRLGYDSAYELVGRAVAVITAPDTQAPKIPQHLSRIGGRLNDLAIKAYYRKDGSIYYSENTSMQILYQGRPAVLVIGQDVTERMQYEQRLEASLAEKEVMLREIHHRVKNNLNVIIALIDLQKSLQADEGVLRVFKELRMRAYTMALVHESLYRSPNLARIDFSKYLQTLVGHIYSAYGPGEGNAGAPPVNMQLDVQNVSLNVETAIPCGLIVNELVTNALKYGFPATYVGDRSSECQIRVSLYRRGSGEGERLILSVSDNGVGLPKDFEIQSVQSLGMQLVQILARQLSGELKLVSDQGVNWTLIFSERNTQTSLL
jgi:PAS domain S-box-containing protein